MSQSSESVTVQVPQFHVGQGYIRDPRGEGFRKDLFRWSGVAKLSWQDKLLNAFVYADSRTEDLAEGSRKHWADLLCLAAAKAIENETLSAFKVNDVRYCIPGGDSAAPTEVKVFVSPEYMDQLNSDYEHDRAARESFRYAANRLSGAVDYGISREANSLYFFLQSSLDAAHLGTMYGWYREKMGGIRSRMSDLARRKNKSRDGYTAARDYIQSQLYSFSPPEAWIDRPPVLHDRS